MAQSRNLVKRVLRVQDYQQLGELDNLQKMSDNKKEVSRNKGKSKVSKKSKKTKRS